MTKKIDPLATVRTGSRSQLAKELGVSPVSIMNKINDGTLIPAIINKEAFKGGAQAVMDLDYAKRLYQPSKMASDSQKIAKGLAPTAKVVDGGDGDGDGLVDVAASNDAARLLRARADKEAALAAQEDIALQRMRAEVVDMVVVEHVLFALVRETRNQLLALPAVYAVELARNSSNADKVVKLREMIEARLEALSDPKALLAEVFKQMDDGVQQDGED